MVVGPRKYRNSTFNANRSTEISKKNKPTTERILLSVSAADFKPSILVGNWRTNSSAETTVGAFIDIFSGICSLLRSLLYMLLLRVPSLFRHALLFVLLVPSWLLFAFGEFSVNGIMKIGRIAIVSIRFNYDHVFEITK